MTQEQMKKISQEKYIDIEILEQVNRESKNDAEFSAVVDLIVEIGNPIENIVK